MATKVIQKLTPFKTLILFTGGFPYGNGETYLESELPYLLETFGRVIIVTKAQKTPVARPLPQGVTVISRPYSLTFSEKLQALAGVFNPYFASELKFIKQVCAVPLSMAIINTVLHSLFKVKRTATFLNELIKTLPDKGPVTLYSYWADDNAVSLAFYKMNTPGVKAVSRAHRWDIYFEKNAIGYLPFRTVLAQNLDSLFFISDDGKRYFENLTNSKANSLKVSRLGVFPVSSPAQKNEGAPFHILSCSALIERKRVSLIAEALKHIPSELKVRWTHIGDGPLMSSLAEEVKSIVANKPNIEIKLTGNLANKDVKAFYQQNYIDLFVNVSESEGVPVSIMEAMSAHVPALATDVDGNGEIVNTDTGILVNKNVTPEELAGKLKEFMLLNNTQQLTYRNNAYNMFEANYNAEKNYRYFAEAIS